MSRKRGGIIVIFIIPTPIIDKLTQNVTLYRYIKKGEMEDTIRIRLSKDAIDKLDVDSKRYEMSRAGYIEFLIENVLIDVRAEITQSVTGSEVKTTQVVTNPSNYEQVVTQSVTPTIQKPSVVGKLEDVSPVVEAEMTAQKAMVGEADPLNAMNMLRLFRKDKMDKAMENYCFNNDMDREALMVNKNTALDILKIYFSPEEEGVSRVKNEPIFFDTRKETETLGEFKGSCFKKNEKKDTNKFRGRNTK